jgi:hypothetical protein
MGTEYQKVQTPFKRDPATKKLLVEERSWTDFAIGAIADSSDWFFTEKIDGTNIRVIWDGYRASYSGRTDNATFSSNQDLAIRTKFLGEEAETLFEQQFGANPAVLYGELYGAGVQSGGNYRSDLDFILFDVRIDDLWLHRPAVEDVARGMNVDVVPVILGEDQDANLWDAIKTVSKGMGSQVALKNSGNDVFAEGLVGTTYSGLLNRRGERIIVKVKHRDFYTL